MKKKKYKLPENYFCINDMTPQDEVEECIIQECESAGLEITEDEELASERCYDRAFEVVNPYKDKLKNSNEIMILIFNQNLCSGLFLYFSHVLYLEPTYTWIGFSSNEWV